MYTVDQLERELDQSNFPMERYRPIEKLGPTRSGGGALGSYLCFDEFLEEEVVVKKLGILDMDQLVEFQREATILCRLRSKSLAQVVDFGATADGATYIVYEYQTGTGLFDYLCGGETACNTIPAMVLSPALAYRVFIPVAEALSGMHSQGILHRDIKSSNILIRNLEAQDSAVYLLDAGSGRVRHATEQALSFEGRTVTGDPHYLAPEQLLIQQYDARSEIFAFGCTFFEALTGKTPFYGPDALSHLARRISPSLTQVAGSLTFNYRLEAFVRKCLEKNPDARYKSMQDALYALRDLVKNKVSFENSGDSKAPPADSSAQSTIERAKARRAKFKSTGNKLKLLAPDEERLVSESDLAEAGSKINEKEPTPAAAITKVETVSRSSRTTNTGTSSNAISTTNQDTINGGITETSNPKFKGKLHTYVASLRQLLSPIATPRDRLLAIAIFTVTLVCGLLAASYIEFLSAPRLEEHGIVYAYEPATINRPGQITLGVEAFHPGVTYIQDGRERGILEKHHIVIESPEENLPFLESGQGFSNELHDTTLFERDSLNLNSLNSRSEEEEFIESDLRIGETWSARFRQQNGIRYLESVANGSAVLINPEMQDVHRTISHMYRALIAQARNPGSAMNFVTRDWAAADYNSSVALKPPPHAIPIPRLFPANDIKLKSLNNTCEVLLRTPKWMTAVGYLSVKLRIENEGWRIEEIAPATHAEWEQL